MTPSFVDVVLVRPSRPANVAAACRAMKNMGLRTLRIVGRPEGLERPEVRGLAYGAWDVLDAATFSPSLEDAVATSTFVVGTSGRPDPQAWTPRRLAEEAGRLSGGGRVALVFGPEASGLSNEELSLCHLRVQVPTDPDQPSLNLAQAVLLIGYEIRLASLPSPPVTESPRATTGELEETIRSLRTGLLAIGYLNQDNPNAILAELRALLVRAGPTPREVALLRGLARQLLWAAGRIARGTAPDT